MLISVAQLMMYSSEINVRKITGVLLYLFVV